jgi:hypothetical protein
MKGQCAKLRAQVHELEDQICALEEDSVKLRIALKNQVCIYDTLLITLFNILLLDVGR